jgi:indolepyruvate ferredoxin oxidoreductase, beta subunit
MTKGCNFLITGVGGQGTVVASDILAAVGLKAGYDVKKSDVTGLAVRGGSVISHVRWGERVRSPIVPEGRVDILVAFELLEGLRWLNQLGPESTIVLNRQRIYPVAVSSGLARYPSMEDTEAHLLKAVRSVYLVRALDVAKELGQTRVLNVVLLGALSGLTEIEPEVWVEVIRARVPAKAVEMNVEGFRRGRQILGESRLVARTERAAAV